MGNGKSIHYLKTRSSPETPICFCDGSGDINDSVCGQEAGGSGLQEFGNTAGITANDSDAVRHREKDARTQAFRPGEVDQGSR